MDKLAIRIGKKIRELREAQGITSEQLAYENDLSKGYLSLIENGKRRPSLEVLEQLAKALDVKITELFGEEDERD
jgi:transcriptional regulator with XRE-family HTH domain